MRNDMEKVLTTRPRHGGNGGSRKTYESKSNPRERRCHKGVDVDLRPKRESMRRRHHFEGDAKFFSDHLSPVVRFLISKVGEPWDDVWSEICAVFKGGGVNAQHIKGHIKQMVGGIPHSGECSFDDADWFSDERGYYRDGVYVDKNKILRRSKPKKYTRPKNKYYYVREGATVEYHTINGCWFRIDLASYDEDRRTRGYYSFYLRRYVHWYAVSKKALSKKEAKRLNLANRYETVAPLWDPEV